MAITKVTSGLISADASSIDLNIDAGTLYLDVSENRVGIATTSPSKTLHVNGELQIENNLTLNENTPAMVIPNGDFRLFTGGSEKMRIDSSGAVGIGQVPETARWSGHDILQVGGRATFLGNDTVTSTGQTVLLDNLYYDASGNFQHRGDSRGVAMQFVEGQVIFSNSNQTTGTPTVSERMRIDSSGNVLVGKTSTSQTVEGIVLQGADGRLNASADGNVAGIFNRLTNDGDIFLFRKDGSTVGSISVTASATAYNTSSDYRLKENVDYTFDATTRLKQLKPARFNFIADETNTLVDGFLAHEVSSVVPEAITGVKDAVDSDGNPKYQSIDQSKLVPLLTKAIQEQQTIIDDLKTRIETLESA